MDCFIGDPSMRKLFYDYISRELWKPGHSSCTVEVMDYGCFAPRVKLHMRNGKELTESLQELIPETLSMAYPTIGVAIKVDILHCDAHGILWFRPSRNKEIKSDKGLAQLIKRRLSSYMVRKSQPVAPLQLPLAKSWKNYYYYGEGQVFIYTSPDRKQSFRVKLTSDTRGLLMNVFAFFMDYGITQSVKSGSLLPAYLVDPILCFIPPQVLIIVISLIFMCLSQLKNSFH